MLQRLFLGTLLLLIPYVISTQNLEDDLFEAQLQRVDRSLVSEEEEGSGQEDDGSGSGTPCEDSMFGCCLNSPLPAHGPQQVGCCLQGGGGCCPDFQRSQSSGQDCGCDSSVFGCCPDGVTAKWNEDDGGCGCKHTTFGCCQDQFTTATGEMTASDVDYMSD